MMVIGLETLCGSETGGSGAWGFELFFSMRAWILWCVFMASAFPQWPVVEGEDGIPDLSGGHDGHVVGDAVHGELRRFLQSLETDGSHGSAVSVGIQGPKSFPTSGSRVDGLPLSGTDDHAVQVLGLAVSVPDVVLGDGEGGPELGDLGALLAPAWKEHVHLAGAEAPTLRHALQGLPLAVARGVDAVCPLRHRPGDLHRMRLRPALCLDGEHT